MKSRARADQWIRELTLTQWLWWVAYGFSFVLLNWSNLSSLYHRWGDCTYKGQKEDASLCKAKLLGKYPSACTCLSLQDCIGTCAYLQQLMYERRGPPWTSPFHHNATKRHIGKTTVCTHRVANYPNSGLWEIAGEPTHENQMQIIVEGTTIWRSWLKSVGDFIEFLFQTE